MSQVFVYGSLKRGFSNASWMSGQKFLFEATTAPLYRMFDYGGFPALIEAATLVGGPPGIAIAGEIWEVDKDGLGRLDELEGVDVGLYRRGKISIVEPELLEVIGYLYTRDLDGLPDVGSSWGIEMDCGAS